MNTKEHVMLAADSNYIPVRYSIMEVTVGNALASSWVWLKCIGKGIDTEAHFTEYTEGVEGDNLNVSLLTGTLGEYLVQSLSTIKPYKSPLRYIQGPFELG